ncbi:hypothetical protein QYE76_021336 [Lolium multiflorum]|uniref:Transposon protein, putative, CACTA, En/Spm sub-class n=1 Tax=Lolium multiflorum TaxID=4521 RepID=A0AAD8R9C8_LOLMU|nr:hypothetical protein QYE76_021336 [Lolium multiflorum]
MEEDEEGDDIDESYLDHFGDTFMDDAEGGEGEGEGDQEEARDEPADDLGRTIADARSRCETEKERENLDRMLEDHKKSLYPGCDNGLKKLGCTLDLLRWKAQEGVADSGFENLLKMLKNMFPKNNELPSSTYEAKKVVCPLGLEVLKIHACINDCILYRGEYENLNECPVCTALRYKIRGDDPGDDVEGQKPRKKVPAKVMWYAPIIPRLKRLFRNKEHAKLLRWHKEDRKSDGELRHPADGTQWRKIDREFKDFAADARNIRFGLSTDGMNPFGEQSSSHSTWPVTLCIYNLPPWLCMKRKFIMMPVLIQEYPRAAQGAPWAPDDREARPGPGPRPYGVAASSALLRRLFAYLKPLHRKPLRKKPRYAKPSRAATIAKPRSGGQESLFRHPAGRGSAPEGSSIDTAAISTAIFITAAAPMKRE